MNGLTVLGLAAALSLAYSANAFRLSALADRQAARHERRMREIAEAQRDRARAERDDALEFADEMTAIFDHTRKQAAVAAHPATRAQLTVVGK